MFSWMTRARMEEDRHTPSLLHLSLTLSPGIQTKNTPNSSHYWVRQTIQLGEQSLVTHSRGHRRVWVQWIWLGRLRKRPRKFTLSECRGPGGGQCVHTRGVTPWAWSPSGSTFAKSLRVADRPRAHMFFALQACLPCTRVGVWWRKPGTTKVNWGMWDTRNFLCISITLPFEGWQATVLS